MAKSVIVTTMILVLMAAGVMGLLGAARSAADGNVDPDFKWAWSTNAGWINFDPPHGGVTVYADHLEGYAWGENIGWIRTGTHTGGGRHTYGNTSAADYGVNVDGSGKLSGYAWSTNIGWISFDAAHGGATIDPVTGSLDGYAWGENVGWIHFKHTAAPVYNVAAPPADLLVTQSVNPAVALRGQTVAYTLIFSNAGAGTATDVVITDTLSVNITNTSVISTGLAITNTGAIPSYVWSVEDLSPGAAGVITITGTLSGDLPAGHTFTSTVTITTSALDSDPTNNSAPARVTVGCRVHLPLVVRNAGER